MAEIFEIGTRRSTCCNAPIWTEIMQITNTRTTMVCVCRKCYQQCNVHRIACRDETDVMLDVMKL